MHAALRPGGRLLLEHLHRDNLVRRFQPDTVVEREGNLMIDRHRVDLATGRIFDERIIVRAGRVRRLSFFLRMISFTELRAWLSEAGFSAVEAYGPEGEPLTLESRRMLVVALK